MLVCKKLKGNYKIKFKKETGLKIACYAVKVTLLYMKLELCLLCGNCKAKNSEQIKVKMMDYCDIFLP